MSYTIFLFYSAIVFILGACIGSFANVCIYRMPRGRSIVLPRSSCPHCGEKIAWYDNIPLSSFFLLSGKCRSCKEKIAARYFIVELLTAALFFVIWLQYGVSVKTPVYWLIATGLIIGTFIDFDFMIIPDQITIGGIFAGFILSFAFPALHGATSAFAGFKASFLGFLCGALSLWLVGELGRLAFRKEAMGMGDVKLLGALGAFLGWKAVLFIIMGASLAGALAGMAMVLTGNKQMSSKIPFGPYLALAAVGWIIGGHEAWFAYVNWLRGLE